MRSSISWSMRATPCRPTAARVTIRTSNVDAVDCAAHRQHRTDAAGDYVLIEVSRHRHRASHRKIRPRFSNRSSPPSRSARARGSVSPPSMASSSRRAASSRSDSEIGKGTTFDIYLPRYVPQQTRRRRNAREERRPRRDRDVTGPGHDPSRRRRRRGAQLCRARVAHARLHRARSAGRRSRARNRAPPSRPDRSPHHRCRDAQHGRADDGARGDQAQRPTCASSSCRATPKTPSAATKRRSEELHFLPKPFGLKQLVAKVKDVLAGAPPRRAPDTLHDTGT